MAVCLPLQVFRVSTKKNEPPAVAVPRRRVLELLSKTALPSRFSLNYGVPPFHFECLLHVYVTPRQDRDTERAKEIVAHHFMDADEIKEASAESASATAGAPITS